jgi:hypothetical protein
MSNQKRHKLIRQSGFILSLMALLGFGVTCISGCASQKNTGNQQNTNPNNNSNNQHVNPPPVHDDNYYPVITKYGIPQTDYNAEKPNK